MIYDCSIIHNELDLLELRIRELGNIVDRFVVAEASTTHSGKPKETVLSGDLSRFGDKLIPVIVRDMPNGDSWTRIAHQRDALLKAIPDASDDDVFMISDIDELPAKEKVEEWMRGNRDLARFAQNFCYYWANCMSGLWYGTKICTVGEARRIGSVEKVRHAEPRIIPDGGWHFSYLGGVRQVQEKLGSFTHTELDTPEWNSERHIKFVSSLGIDLFLRDGMEFKFFDPNLLPSSVRSFPQWIKDVKFTEDWYPNGQIIELFKLSQAVEPMEGECIEIGCWEGRSTIALAHGLYPQKLYAVDTWEGSKAENPNHESVTFAKRRDVHAQFLRNISELTDGNVIPVKSDGHEFLRNFSGRIKFAHIDACHDYDSVSKTLQLLKPLMTRCGIICGDDIIASSVNRRDLNGGVERAVNEHLPGYKTIGNLWHWRNRKG